MADAPTILQAAHVSRAISDPAFYALMPEFLTIKRKIEAMHVDLSSGCSPCKKRRIASAVNSDFVSILNTLSDSGFARLKKYFGVSRLLVRAMGSDGKVVMKEV